MTSSKEEWTTTNKIIPRKEVKNAEKGTGTNNMYVMLLVKDAINKEIEKSRGGDPVPQ